MAKGMTKAQVASNLESLNKLINNTKYNNSDNLKTLDYLINNRLAGTWDTAGGQSAVKSMNSIYKDLEKTMNSIEDLYNNLNSFCLTASYEERSEEKRI